MSYEQHIYAGFADGLKDLNECIVSDLMVSTKAGRAYKTAYKEREGVYIDSIHVEPVDEDDKKHLSLMHAFNENLDRYGGGVYMGAAGLMNLGYIAAARPSAVILYDINVAQTVFWNDVIQALKNNPTVGGFIQFLKDERKTLPAKLKSIFNGASLIARIPDLHTWEMDGTHILNPVDIYRNSCCLDFHFDRTVEMHERFLLEDLDPDKYWVRQGYDHLHALAKNGAIGALTLDVLDENACRQLQHYLDTVKYTRIAPDNDTIAPVEKTGARVNKMYVSNIFYFLQGKGVDFCERAIKGAAVDRARENLSMLVAKKWPHGMKADIIHHEPDIDSLGSWPQASTREIGSARDAGFGW